MLEQKSKKTKSLNLYRNAAEERTAVALEELFSSHLEKLNAAQKSP